MQTQINGPKCTNSFFHRCCSCCCSCYWRCWCSTFFGWQRHAVIVYFCEFFLQCLNFFAANAVSYTTPRYHWTGNGFSITQIDDATAVRPAVLRSKQWSIVLSSAPTRLRPATTSVHVSATAAGVRHATANNPISSNGNRTTAAVTDGCSCATRSFTLCKHLFRGHTDFVDSFRGWILYSWMLCMDSWGNCGSSFKGTLGKSSGNFECFVFCCRLCPCAHFRNHSHGQFLHQLSEFRQPTTQLTPQHLSLSATKYLIPYA